MSSFTPWCSLSSNYVLLSSGCLIASQPCCNVIIPYFSMLCNEIPKQNKINITFVHSTNSLLAKALQHCYKAIGHNALQSVRARVCVTVMQHYHKLAQNKKRPLAPPDAIETQLQRNIAPSCDTDSAATRCRSAMQRCQAKQALQRRM